jgi:hypothetical protein
LFPAAKNAIPQKNPNFPLTWNNYNTRDEFNPYCFPSCAKYLFPKNNDLTFFDF